MVPLLVVVARGYGPPIEFLPGGRRLFSCSSAAGYIGVTQARLTGRRMLNPALELNAAGVTGDSGSFRLSVLGILVVAGFVLFGLVSYLRAWRRGRLSGWECSGSGRVSRVGLGQADEAGSAFSDRHPPGSWPSSSRRPSGLGVQAVGRRT